MTMFARDLSVAHYRSFDSYRLALDEGVTLAGIESVYCPMPRRAKAWERLARDLDPQKLASTVKNVSLEEVLSLGPQILKGQVRGRVVVDVQR